MSESELIRKCKQGDNKARKELYRLYASRMLGLSFRYVGNTEIAHDLLHDGFLKVFTSIQSFNYQGEGSLSAWLYKIFLNVSLEYLRKKDVLKDGFSLDEYSDLPVEVDMDANELPMELLMNFIAELPPGYRTVFNLYVFEEWSHKEIAQYLHINEKSSTSQFYRARKLLAVRVKEALKERE